VPPACGHCVADGGVPVHGNSHRNDPLACDPVRFAITKRRSGAVLVPLILTFLAEHFGTGLAEMMIIGTWVGSLAWATAAFYGPETKGKVLVPDLVVA
jgi:hypothetical protein